MPKLKQLTLFGAQARSPSPKVSLRQKDRKERSAKKRSAPEVTSEPESESGRSTKKAKFENRSNWQDEYDELYGTWIKKVPYTCKKTGQQRYKAGCIICEEFGATKGLGPHPTKRLKNQTFLDHQVSNIHRQVRY